MASVTEKEWLQLELPLNLQEANPEKSEEIFSFLLKRTPGKGYGIFTHLRQWGNEDINHYVGTGLKVLEVQNAVIPSVLVVPALSREHVHNVRIVKITSDNPNNYCIGYQLTNSTDENRSYYWYTPPEPKYDASKRFSVLNTGSDPHDRSGLYSEQPTKLKNEFCHLTVAVFNPHPLISTGNGETQNQILTFPEIAQAVFMVELAGIPVRSLSLGLPDAHGVIVLK